MENNKRRADEPGNTVTRELFVDANSEETPTEKILDIEDQDEEEAKDGPPGDE